MRPSVPGSGTAVVALAVVLLLTGNFAAGTPFSRTYSAPYHHASVANSNNRANSGCSVAAGALAHWKATTGIGKFNTVAQAKKCPRSSGPVASGSYGYASSQSVISLPIVSRIGSAGITSVQTTWAITPNGSQSIALRGNCPRVTVSSTTGNGSRICDLGAEVGLSAFAYLEDLTNGSIFYPANLWLGNTTYSYVYNDTYCTTFSCVNYNGTGSFGTNFSRSFSVSFWINATLSLLDRYDLITGVSGFSYAWVDGYPRSSARATLDLGGTVDRYALTSVVVT